MGLQNFLSGRKVNIMGAEQELGAWIDAEREKARREAQEGYLKRLFTEQPPQSYDEWQANVREQIDYLKRPEIHDAFEACAQLLRKRFKDVKIRIVNPVRKPLPTVSGLALTWNYGQEGSDFSCDVVGARVALNHVDFVATPQQEIAGIRLFENTRGFATTDVFVPIGRELIEKLLESIKNPNRRRQSFVVEHPSLFKRVARALS